MKGIKTATENEVTTAEIMKIIEDVLVEIYNGEYDEIKSRIEKLLLTKKK